MARCYCKELPKPGKARRTLKWEVLYLPVLGWQEFQYQAVYDLFFLYIIGTISIRSQKGIILERTISNKKELLATISGIQFFSGVWDLRIF
jgi:hypothetical protein